MEVLSKVSPSEMVEAQQADPTISQVVQWLKACNKPKLSQIGKKIQKLSGSISTNSIIWSLEMEYFIEFIKYGAPNIISWYYQQFTELKITMLHDEQGHQRTECTMALMRERFFWRTMYQNVNNWVKSCKWCKKVNGLYNDPNVKQRLLISNHPLEMLCLDFTTMDYSRDGKENVLVMMNNFSNFTVVFITPN